MEAPSKIARYIVENSRGQTFTCFTTWFQPFLSYEGTNSTNVVIYHQKPVIFLGLSFSVNFGYHVPKKGNVWYPIRNTNIQNIFLDYLAYCKNLLEIFLNICLDPISFEKFYKITSKSYTRPSCFGTLFWNTTYDLISKIIRRQRTNICISSC